LVSVADKYGIFREPAQELDQ